MSNGPARGRFIINSVGNLSAARVFLVLTET